MSELRNLRLENIREVCETDDVYLWKRACGARISLSQLKDTIENEELEPPRIRILKNDRYFDPRILKGISNGRLRLSADFKLIEDAIAKDSTLVVDNVAPLNADLSALCEEVSKMMGRTCPGNLYCSTVPSSGFGVHADQHHVLVVQLEGKKRWKIESRRTEFADFEIEAGDVLFVRQGIRHNVNSLGVLSVHITIAIN
jgi:ribosomal protein L16 Arg81 hydroxylase